MLEPAPVPREGDNLPHKPPATLRVLYIEDDLVDQMAFRRMLRDQKLEFSCSLASSVAEGRERLAADTFDAVITDFNLGDGSARDILALRPACPIIIVTGMGDEETAVAALRAGASDYLIKDGERNYLKVLPVTVENSVSHYRSLQRVELLSTVGAQAWV